MNLLVDAPVWLRLVLALLLIGAAVQDVRTRRIANGWCGAVIGLAVVTATVTGPTVALWQNALVFAALIALGLPLFAAGWLGGGDVKLLASLGLWSNLGTILPLLAAILIAGGVVAALSLARGGRAARRSKGIPYGVAIAIGGLIVMAWTGGPPSAPPASPLDLGAARGTIGT